MKSANMFRSILNKQKKQQRDDTSTGTQQTTSGDSESTQKTASSSISLSRRKFTSMMMNKLQSSGRRLGSLARIKSNKKSKNVMKQDQVLTCGHQSLPFEFDDDDDDDDYKSAEEGADEETIVVTKQVALMKQLKLAEGDKFVLPEEQCDIPTFLNTQNCDRELIDETRRLLKERFAKNPDSFYDSDYKRMLSDDWTVTRFLLRRRLDPKRTAKLMEECGRFRKQYKMSEVQLWEFPIEFHKAGGLFSYAPDRVGNVTMWMRVKMYRRVPEISDVFKAFILCVLEQCDVASKGRGTAVIFDLSACGLQNVDLGFLSWLLSSFRNYCPKGVGYILVYNLPWILNATCKLAMTWMSASNRRALRFVHGKEIENFIARENLPDYCGGTCQIDYRSVPDGSKPAIDVCDRLDMTREQALKIRELFKEYLEDDYDKISEKATKQHQLDARSNYDDAKSTIADNQSEQQQDGQIGNGNGIVQQQANGNTTTNRHTHISSSFPVFPSSVQVSSQFLKPVLSLSLSH